ncbi:hypothetical protein [Saccharothrix sp. ALI-22-I]|uniref:hypothetical protein n=1 Tax=Saccharothrix sp. ALI-22-I TaxID=1933778 RepID=UPI00097BC73E|nr:hypothetical protein [Saccharothrix sp. ALI-22-I]
MTMPYVWWHSGYDRLCHAFPVRQASEVYFEAACAHSVPPDLVVRTPGGALCVPCLVEVGSAMDDDHGWRD